MKASCHCGAVSVEVGVPITDVNVCHCQACQRRTGAPFGMIAWLPDGAVTVNGETRASPAPPTAGGNSPAGSARNVAATSCSRRR